MNEEYDENTTKLKDINEGISFTIVNNDRLIDEYFTSKQYEAAFNRAYMNYTKISMYDPTNKELLEELSNILEEYFSSLSGRPTNQQELIMLGERKMQLKELIKRYIVEVRIALKSVSLWLKVYKVNDDRDEQFSRESFGTEVKLLPDKILELKLLSSEELLGLMSPNMVSFVHSRALIKEAK